MADMGIVLAMLLIVVIAIGIMTLLYAYSASNSAAKANANATEAMNQVGQFYQLEPNAIANQLAQNNNGLTLTIKGEQANLSQSINAITANTIAAQSSLQTQITNDYSPIPGELATINESIRALPNVSRFTNFTNTIKSVILNTSTNAMVNIEQGRYTIPTNTYFYSPMLPGYANHVNITANQSVTLYILTNKNYILLATNKTFSTTGSYTGNQLNFWFNQSEGCNNYVYAVAGSQNSVSIRLNMTGRHKPNATINMC